MVDYAIKKLKIAKMYQKKLADEFQTTGNAFGYIQHVGNVLSIDYAIDILTNKTNKYGELLDESGT